MNHLGAIFKPLIAKPKGYSPTIVCLYTGEDCPPFCAPMLRRPDPQTGMVLDISFVDYYAAALALNPAVHDGAVMVGRRTKNDPYVVMGWSYRLFPPSMQLDDVPNRGSAFNSCVAMSMVPEVDCLYLVTGGAGFCFVRGMPMGLSMKGDVDTEV